jgi:hypothetical protein
MIVNNIRRKYLMDALLLPKKDERKEAAEKILKNVET